MTKVLYFWEAHHKEKMIATPATPSLPNDRQKLEQDEEFQRRLSEAAEEAKTNEFLLAGKFDEMAAKHNALVDRIEHLEQELQHHKMQEQHKGHD